MPSKLLHLRMIKTRLSPCIWFDNQAEDVDLFYVSIFMNGLLKVDKKARVAS